MNECALIPTLPIEVWHAVGRHLIDSSSKKKLHERITRFITAFLCNFIEDLKTREDKKAFISDVTQTLFEYSLKSKKVTFLDLSFHSFEEEASFLKKYRHVLGTVAFEVPRHSIEEIQSLCKQAEISEIVLYGMTFLKRSLWEKIESLPKIKKLQLRGFLNDKIKVELEKIENAAISLVLNWSTKFTLEELSAFNIKKISIGNDICFDKRQFNADEIN